MVSDAGDVNGDGVADLIVGAGLDSTNGTFRGSARVLSGVDGSVLHDFEGDTVGDLFGTSVSGAGDVNGDGFADLIVGALFDDNNGFNSGVHGCSQELTAVFSTPSMVIQQKTTLVVQSAARAMSMAMDLLI